MKKILIIGDSFAADWSVKYNDYKGWPNLLAEKYDVTNVAQAGVSEYKIYKQLAGYKDKLDMFDIFIVNHTSPYRVPTIGHPVHEYDALHHNADLMYSDIDYHSKQWKNFFNRSLRAAKGFFIHHYDEEFYYTTSMLYRKEIEHILNNRQLITLNVKSYMAEHKGLINHLSEVGNQLVYNRVNDDIINRIK